MFFDPQWQKPTRKQGSWYHCHVAPESITIAQVPAQAHMWARGLLQRAVLKVAPLLTRGFLPLSMIWVFGGCFIRFCKNSRVLMLILIVLRRAQKRPRIIAFAIYAVMQVLFAATSLATPTPPQNPKEIELSKPLVIHWRYASEQMVNLTPSSDGDRVYLPLSSGQIISLGAETGQLIWKSDVGGEISASPVADEHGVYVASERKDSSGQELITGGALRLLSRDTGVTLWIRTLSTAPAVALSRNADTIFAGGNDGRVYAIRKSTGDVVWSKQIDSRVTSQLTLAGSRLYIGSEFGNVYALDQHTGKLIWYFQTRSAVQGRFALANGLIYFGSADGYVYAVSEDKGKKSWRTRTGAGVQSVLSVNEGLLASSFDNFVYFLSLRNGNRLWKRQLPGRLAAEPLAAFDGVLFTPLSAESGIVLSLRNGKQLNSLPLGEESSSNAAPIFVRDLLLISTRHGLLAFAHPKVEDL